MDTTETQNQLKEVIRAVQGISWQEAGKAVGTLIIGLVIIRLLMNGARRASSRFAQTNQALTDFLLSVLRVLLLFVLLSTVLSQLGIPMTSLLALISLIALAISLSVQNLLTNVISGIVVLANRPFVPGDWVEMPSVSGSVETINLFYTHLVTADNQLILIPNSEVASQRIINYSAKPTRRLNLIIRVGSEYETDRVLQALMRACVRAGEGHETDRPPFTAVMEYRENGVNYVARLFVPTKDYWETYHLLHRLIREELEKDGILLTYGATRVNLEKTKAGKEHRYDEGRSA